MFSPQYKQNLKLQGQQQSMGIEQNFEINKFLSQNEQQQAIKEKNRQQREIKIQKYKNKKRNWQKTVNYDCRKKVADKRVRVKGRFISKNERENSSRSGSPYQDENQCTSENLQENNNNNLQENNEKQNKENYQNSKQINLIEQQKRNLYDFYEIQENFNVQQKQDRSECLIYNYKIIDNNNKINNQNKYNQISDKNKGNRIKYDNECIQEIDEDQEQDQQQDINQCQKQQNQRKISSISNVLTNQHKNSLNSQISTTDQDLGSNFKLISQNGSNQIKEKKQDTQQELEKIMDIAINLEEEQQKQSRVNVIQKASALLQKKIAKKEKLFYQVRKLPKTQI